MYMIPLVLGLLNTSASPQIQPTPIVFAAAAQGDGRSTHILAIGGAQIEVDVHLAQSDIAVEDVVTWVERSAQAVANYYGRFPDSRARVIVTQSSDGGQSIHGTTWGNIGERYVKPILFKAVPCVNVEA
jgi:hypothetical protein